MHPIKLHHVCLKKRSFPTQREANKALIKHRHYNDMKTYKCPHCHCWHIGHVKRKGAP